MLIVDWVLNVDSYS
jgi:hypothetical protein